MQLRPLPSTLLLALASTGSHAAVFAVTTIDSDGPGSLRQAILDANAAVSPPPHRIEFAEPFPLQGSVELFGALPALQVAAEIDGMDRQPTIMPFDPSNSFPMLRTNSSLILRRFQLMQGRADIRGGCVGGEGVGSNDVLVIERMTFSGCVAAAAGDAVATGGAVFWPSTAPITIADSIFQGNAAVSVTGGVALGGALLAYGPTRVESSYFIGNIINGGTLFGGAINLSLPTPGVIEILDSVFVDNHAEPDAVPSPSGTGGALSLDCTSCTMRLERNFFGSNHSQYGGAAFLRGNNGVDAADITLHNNAFAGNHADNTGGALFVNGARMDVRHATFHDNGATTGSHAAAFNVTIAEWSNSVMADVADGSGAGCSLGAIATIATGNFMGIGGGCNVALPGIAPVADFRFLGMDDGELMPVVVFDRASPVVDGGDDGRCLATDARGRDRAQDGNGDGIARCDAGAFEARGIHLFSDGFED